MNGYLILGIDRQLRLSNHGDGEIQWVKYKHEPVGVIAHAL